MSDADWWRGACIYQIYPRSFYDSNGDGIGDLNGITDHLDYVAELGVDGIWISPFFTSPMKDFGYDVADYRDVDPIFGTLDDFKTLLHKAHDLNLKIIIDLVLSHTSDQQPWFTEKPEYYVWADPKPDMFGVLTPPNNWVSVFGGPAWTWHEEREQFYLHNFLKEQPDLNFHNPDVQQEALDAAQFWLDMGVDGFRLDVVNFYVHDKELRDNPPRDADLGPAVQFEGDDPYSQQNHIYDKSRPENLDFLRKLRKLMDQYPGTFTLGELGDDHPYERTVEYTGDGLLNTCYNTQLMSGKHKNLTTDLIREPIEHFQSLCEDNWPSWAFSNHDVVRVASRWLPDSDGFSQNPDCSKMLIALLGCLRGTAFLYQGEELGLPEARLNFYDLQDPWGKHLWPEWQGRDGCRTPLSWNGKEPEGSWLPVAEEHKDMCVEKQIQDEQSVLNFTRDFLAFRKQQTALTKGTMAFLSDDQDVLHFERSHDGTNLFCCFNLTDTTQHIQTFLLGNPEVLFSNNFEGETLEPFGFAIIQVG